MGQLFERTSSTQHNQDLSIALEKHALDERCMFFESRFCVFCVFVALSSMISFFTQHYKVEMVGDDKALTDNDGVLLGEFVSGNLEVQGGGTLANTARNVVMRTVARAEPATKVTGLTDGHTTQVSADT